MAKIYLLVNADGSKSYGASVNVKPFKRTWRSFESKVEATKWRDELTTELKKQRAVGGTRPDLASLSVASLNSAYLADPETKALRYYSDLVRQLRWWSAKYGTCKVLEFGVLELREARDKLMPGRQPATVVRILSAQRSAWNWGRAAGLVPKDRVWPPRLMLSEPAARVRYLTDEELSATLQAAKAHSSTLLAAVTLALATGVRRGEMLRLRWADVDFPRSTIRLLLTKNEQARSVHLPAIAAEALKGIKAEDVPAITNVFLNAKDKPLTGDALDHEWRKVRTAAGIKNFRWHDFRHSAASFLAQHGATLLEIGSVLGHKSAQVTLKYAHLIEGAPVTGHSALDAKLRKGGQAKLRRKPQSPRPKT
jgi:integrase